MIVAEESEGQFTSGTLKSPRRTSFNLSTQKCEMEANVLKNVRWGLGRDIYTTTEERRGR